MNLKDHDVELAHVLAALADIPPRSQFDVALRSLAPNQVFDLVAFFDDTVAKMRATLIAKNADYAGAVEADPFANFSRVETLGICSTEVGFLTRMTDKICRIASFAKRGTLSVKDESVTDTLLDLANYSILMAAYLAAKKAKG